MNIDLIIEALEDCIDGCDELGCDACMSKLSCIKRDALAEARKMKEPCEMIELLSEYAHDAWAGWMRYLFSKSTINADGTVTIPKWAVERWRRQIGTKYSDLSDSEKMSDRKEAETILSIVQKLKEPCVWKTEKNGAGYSVSRPTCPEWEKDGNGIGYGNAYGNYCPCCGRKVKYES